MALRSSFPILYVADVPASLRFYRDLLGFALVYSFPPDEEQAFASLSLGEDKLGLSPAAYPPGHGLEIGSVTGRPCELCLEADDVDATIDELRGAGVVVLAEPADRPWGERVAYVADPDGNPVHIRGSVARA